MTVKVEFSRNTVELEVKYLYNHLNEMLIRKGVFAPPVLIYVSR